MKKIIILIMSSMLVPASTTFNVDGMMCGVSCVNKIKTQVGTLEGINSCDVNFEQGIMVVDYNETQLDDNQIINLLTNTTTYKITELTADTRTTKLNLEKSSCCANKKKKGFFKRFLDWF